jgi:hypothetical protein
VDILVEDRLAATVLARAPRADLAARGHADPAHGFRARLPSWVWPDRSETMVWARVQGARRGFARRLLSRPLAEPVPPREAALARRIADLSDRLAGLPDAANAPAAAPELPFVRHPRVTLALPVGSGARLEDARRRLAALAPLARARSAEMLVLAEPAMTGILPLAAMIPNVRLVAAAPDLFRAVARHARGDTVALLDPEAGDASPALLADRLLDPLATPGTAPPGVLAIAPRAVWLGGWAAVRTAR